MPEPVREQLYVDLESHREVRALEVDKEMNRRAKVKRIVKLESEIKLPKTEIQVLRGLLYESK